MREWQMVGGGRTEGQCLNRWTKSVNPILVKVPWSKEEDDLVKRMVLQHGVGEVRVGPIGPNVHCLLEASSTRTPFPTPMHTLPMPRLS